MIEAGHSLPYSSCDIDNIIPVKCVENEAAGAKLRSFTSFYPPLRYRLYMTNDGDYQGDGKFDGGLAIGQQPLIVMCDLIQRKRSATFKYAVCWLAVAGTWSACSALASGS